MFPGMGGLKKIKNLEFNDKEMGYVEAIIKSMTRKEREKPEIINGSCRRRIAKGSGTSVQEVNRLIKQFEQTKKMMRQFSDIDKTMKKGGKMPKMPFFH